MAVHQTSIADALSNPVVDNVFLKVGNDSWVEFCLCMSPNYLQLISKRRAFKDLQLLVTAVQSVEAVIKSSQAKGVVTLKLKDFRVVAIEVPDALLCQGVAESIRLLSLPLTLDSLPCFTLHPPSDSERAVLKCEPHSCLLRWGCPSSEWKVTNANEKYKYCQTYPPEVIVPDCANQVILEKVAKYRYLGRFPILCYYHKKSSAPLLISSQPCMGSVQKRCVEDSQYMNSILPYGAKGFIVDTRSEALAQQHLMKGGGGVEGLDGYPRWKVHYADLDSYQQLQASLTRVVDACQNLAMSGSNSWLGKIDGSGWMKNMQLLLGNARAIASYLSKGLPVLVHGDTGYDAELQLAALVQVIMDPHCRTAQGFVELVERQWVSCGHPFSLRHRHCASAPPRASGPVFLAFLDAVHQILRQFPTSFEFNERFLHCVFLHAYLCEYGTFLYDCERERTHSKRSRKSKSLWDHLLLEKTLCSLLNPLYVLNKHQLHVSTIPQDLMFWSNCFLKSNVFENQTKLPVIDQAMELKNENSRLLKSIRDLYKEIEEVQVGKHYQTGDNTREQTQFVGAKCDIDLSNLSLLNPAQKSNITCSTATGVNSSTLENDCQSVKAEFQGLSATERHHGSEVRSELPPSSSDTTSDDAVHISLQTEPSPAVDNCSDLTSPLSDDTAHETDTSSSFSERNSEEDFVTVSQPVTTEETLSGEFVFVDNDPVCSDGK